MTAYTCNSPGLIHSHPLLDRDALSMIHWIGTNRAPLCPPQKCHRAPIWLLATCREYTFLFFELILKKSTINANGKICLPSFWWLSNEYVEAHFVNVFYDSYKDVTEHGKWLKWFYPLYNFITSKSQLIGIFIFLLNQS